MFRTPGFFDGAKKADFDILLIWPKTTRISGCRVRSGVASLEARANSRRFRPFHVPTWTSALKKHSLTCRGMARL